MRYIDADVVIGKIINVRDSIPRKLRGHKYYEFGIEVENHTGNLIRGGLRKALRCINDTPTADVVKVVRCRDCRYFFQEPKPNDFAAKRYRYCTITGINVEYDGFCSYAERRSE